MNLGVHIEILLAFLMQILTFNPVYYVLFYLLRHLSLSILSHPGALLPVRFHSCL